MNELTVSRVAEMMDTIKPGDKVVFAVPGKKVPDSGVVVMAGPRHVLVRHRHSRECVLWDSIRNVNGKPWPLFCVEFGS